MTMIGLRGFTRVLALTAVLGAMFACAPPPAGTFKTPEEAVQAIAELATTQDPNKADELFGPGGFDLISSGDDIADREGARRVREDIQAKVAFEDRGTTTRVAALGNDGWPFPIPLVLEQGRWRFDPNAGREEILNRRIGKNEILTLASMHSYVDAQREYASEGRDGHPPAFAAKLISTEGKHDGLFWPPAAGEPESPMGPLVAAAAREGYTKNVGEPAPFHGYYYRSLTEPGGFALLAWPAKYGNSGVMTFQVNHRGIVFQKDLGADTEGAAAGLTIYGPDETWDPTAD